MPRGQPGTRDELCQRCKVRPKHRDYCRECQRELNRKSDENHPKLLLVREARSGPCVDCGTELPWKCMELDHVFGVKKFSLSGSALRRASIREIVTEISKCELRCPNCHRLRHYRANLEP